MIEFLSTLTPLQIDLCVVAAYAFCFAAKWFVSRFDPVCMLGLICMLTLAGLLELADVYKLSSIPELSRWMHLGIALYCCCWALLASYVWEAIHVAMGVMLMAGFQLVFAIDCSENGSAVTGLTVNYLKATLIIHGLIIIASFGNGLYIFASGGRDDCADGANL